MVNDGKFRRWASTWMKTDFRVKNPHPDRIITAAFTHYMHENSLHWSGCAEGKRSSGFTSCSEAGGPNRGEVLEASPPRQVTLPQLPLNRKDRLS